MRDTINITGMIFLFFAAIVALTFFGFEMNSYFSPKYAALENRVFHETQAYNDGMVRDLENIKMQYDEADKAGKDALRATALHRFSIYPNERLPADLQNFFNNLKGSK